MQSVARTNFASTTPVEEALGRELLTALGRSPSSANAFHLCVQLGLMKHHENLYAREAGIEKVKDIMSYLGLHVYTAVHVYVLRIHECMYKRELSW